jgi:hypothetical protein
MVSWRADNGYHGEKLHPPTAERGLQVGGMASIELPIPDFSERKRSIFLRFLPTLQLCNSGERLW